MKLFRRRSISNLFSLFTGIVFLNMSFFLAEVSALKLDKNKAMMENIAKLIAGSSAEEEKDIFGSSAEEENLGSTELDLFLDHSHASNYFLISTTLAHGAHFNEKPIVQFAEISYPPPKV